MTDEVERLKEIYESKRQVADAVVACVRHRLDGIIWEGMTLRDYYAGQAINVAASEVEVARDTFAKQLAAKAYEIADAMIEARKLSCLSG